MGYTVPVCAATGEGAIKKAAQVKPDLVLMDIRLRGEMDGIQAAKRIQGELNIPVIYLTAHTDQDTMQRALVTEPYGYLVKPIEKRGLNAAIELALYKHQKMNSA